ncbi:MAG: endonuclease [Desulfurococcaceae archaeon]
MKSLEHEAVFIHFDPGTCKGYLYKSSIADELANRWFGKYYQDKLVLELVEVAYLLSTGKVVTGANGKRIQDLSTLVSEYAHCFEEFFWPMLTVFKDLRERGRRVRVLEPMKFLVRDKGSELRLIYVLEEKSLIRINDITEIISEALRNNLKATLAIVSLHGELTYYEISQADLKVD